MRINVSHRADSHFITVKELGVGSIFGELALISQKPRAATVTCLTDCQFATINQKTFNIIKKHVERSVNQKIDILKGVPFFDTLTRIALAKYSNYFTEQASYFGNIVLREGQPLSHLYLVTEGQFEVSQQVEYVHNLNNK